ncbi:hypothetical protein ACP4OV_013274 [Aristida adscensionis]
MKKLRKGSESKALKRWAGPIFCRHPQHRPTSCASPERSAAGEEREALASGGGGGGGGGSGGGDHQTKEKMIYDVNSPLFRSFLSQKGASDKRKIEEHKPKEQRPKASENKPVMNE